MQAQAEKLSTDLEEKARLDVHLQHSHHQLAAAQAAAAAAGHIQDGDLHLLKAQLKVCTSQHQSATVWCEIAALACQHMPCHREHPTLLVQLLVTLQIQGHSNTGSSICTLTPQQPH